MELLKNGMTTNATTMVSSGSSGYNFPSSSFTHQKQPNIPSDQKAKLLAMHRDGKANAGIYVAVVLIVYFILVIILFCRYGRRRRTSETNASLDGTVEQGRARLINSQLVKIVSCGGDDCLGNLASLCFGPCRKVDATPGVVKSGVHLTQTEANGDKTSTATKCASVETELHKHNNQVKGESDNDNGIEKCESNEFRESLQESARHQGDDRQAAEDSEESLEDD